MSIFIVFTNISVFVLLQRSPELTLKLEACGEGEGGGESKAQQ